jgi:hypothetical protein
MVLITLCILHVIMELRISVLKSQLTATPGGVLSVKQICTKIM